jgi:hypothetical protein
MKKLLLYLLLLPALTFGQISKKQMFYALSSGSYNFSYTAIPDAPSDGTSATITYVLPGNILNTSGGDTQNKYLSGAWTTFRAFSLVGTAGTYRRMINENSSTVIGSAAAAFLFNQAGTGTTYYGIYGLSATAPMFFDNVSGDATAAVQSTAAAAGPYAEFINIVNDSKGYLFFANTAGALSGGSSTVVPTSAANYGTIKLSFGRSFNLGTDGTEHIYIGATTTSTYAIHSDLDVDNIFTYNGGWDAIQIGNATNFTLTKSTFVNPATLNVAAQNSGIQISNAYGTVEDCIVLDAPVGVQFSTLNLVFRNNYVRWTNNEANRIVDYYLNYASTNRLMVDPILTEILIEDCDFDATTWTGALFNVADGEVNITIRNCRIEGATSLFADARGGSPTGTLTDGGGNTFVANGTIPVPTFSNYTPTDFNGHGLLTNAYHHALGRGYRTP